MAPAYRACLLFVRVQHIRVLPIGLLTDIAASFSLTEAQAGIMISVYAWGVMLLSLPLMVFASRFEFKRMLLGVLAVFSLGQFLSALAPTYPILACARLVVACAHAVFWSVASIMASRLVDTRHGALAISIIATGSSIAQIFWPADRPRHRAGRGLAHDIRRGRCLLCRRGGVPSRGVSGYAGG